MVQTDSDVEQTQIIERYRLDVSTLLDLQVPRECIAGIEANCELLRVHARKVEAFVIPEYETEETETTEVMDP